MTLLSSLFEEEAASSEPVGLPPGSILAVDLGSIHTRAILLDIAEGRYRLVGRGITPTTVGEPCNDALEGIYAAIRQVSEATGRTLLDENGDLIIPEESTFVGVNRFVATVSAGQPVSAFLIGLVPDISLESGRHAADSIYIKIRDILSLTDKRTVEEQMDALLEADVDLIFAVGGTDGGAEELMHRSLDTVFLAYSLMPTPRPPLLYAGNQDLNEYIDQQADEIGIQLICAPNVRPGLDWENLDGAQDKLVSIYHQRKSQNTPGLDTVGSWIGGDIIPTTHGFSRLVHLMGKLTGQNILGIDLGSTVTTLAAVIKGQAYTSVFADLGIGHSAAKILEHTPAEMLARWLSFSPTDPDEVPNYVWNKSIYPHTIPGDQRSLELEYALTREVIRFAFSSSAETWHNAATGAMFSAFDTILLGGATLTNTHLPGWSMLAIADVVQPTGITRVLADPHGVAPALGAIAPIQPEALVHLLESRTFTSLGTLIAASMRGKSGFATIKDKMGNEAQGEIIHNGSLMVVPLPEQQESYLTLQRAGIEGVRRNRPIPVSGGLMGIVIDTRGRPWRLPSNDEQRRKALRQWQQVVAQEVVS